jgi:hypothetical protein
MDARKLERISCTDSREPKLTLIPHSKVQAFLWVVGRSVAKVQTWYLVTHVLKTTCRKTGLLILRRTPKAKLNGHSQPHSWTKLCANTNRQDRSSQSRQRVTAKEDHVEETPYMPEFLQKHHIRVINEYAWTGTWRIEFCYWESQLSYWLPHKEQLFLIRAERDEAKLIWNHAQEFSGPIQTKSNQIKSSKIATA